MNTNLDNAKDKDAELARWREQALQEDATANALRDQVASLTSLVKELADALDKVLPENADCCDVENTLCKDGCMQDGRCRIDTIRALVAKAREVLNG